MNACITLIIVINSGYYQLEEEELRKKAQLKKLFVLNSNYNMVDVYFTARGHEIHMRLCNKDLR